MILGLGCNKCHSFYVGTKALQGYQQSAVGRRAEVVADVCCDPNDNGCGEKPAVDLTYSGVILSVGVMGDPTDQKSPLWINFFVSFSLGNV